MARPDFPSSTDSITIQPQFSLPPANNTPRMQRHKAFFPRFVREKISVFSGSRWCYRVRIVARRASRVKSTVCAYWNTQSHSLGCARTSMDDSSVSANYRQGLLHFGIKITHSNSRMRPVSGDWGLGGCGCGYALSLWYWFFSDIQTFSWQGDYVRRGRWYDDMGFWSLVCLVGVITRAMGNSPWSPLTVWIRCRCRCLCLPYKKPKVPFCCCLGFFILCYVRCFLSLLEYPRPYTSILVPSTYIHTKAFNNVLPFNNGC